MPRIKFYATLRRLTGVKEVVAPGDTLSQVLERLIGDFPALEAYLPGNESPRLIITLNGHPLDLSGGLDIPLAEADLVAIFPPIGGG